MTTSKTPGTPPTDEELETRLHASWERAMARAVDDLARSDLVPAALASAARRPAWRVAGGAVVGVAAVLALGVALILGPGGRKDTVPPPTSPADPVASPAPASGSLAPAVSPAPGDNGMIPILEWWQTFPPSMDGLQVVQVGPEADAKIAAATDDSPIYVSGWILGPDRLGCPDFDLGSPAPNGVMWKDCAAIPLRATEDGGAALRVHINYTDEARYPRLPDATHVLPVLVRVHAHDAGCTADDCAHKPVLDTVVQYGAPRMAPVLRAMTRPPGGITMEQAVKAADARAAETSLGYGLPLVLLSAEAGPRALVGKGGDMSELDWVWAVRYVSESGWLECWVYVGYLDGSAHEASNDSVSFP